MGSSPAFQRRIENPLKRGPDYLAILPENGWRLERKKGELKYPLKKCWYFERQGFSRQNVGMRFRTWTAGFKTLPLVELP